jgi:hypothetical protein
MEDAQFVGFAGLKFHKHEDHVRFGGWMEEAYMPLSIRTGWLSGLERFHVTKEDPQYPDYVAFYSFDNIQAVKNLWDEKDFVAIQRDVETTFTGKCEWFSHALYRRLRSIKKEPVAGSSSRAGAKPEEVAVISVEAYSLPFLGKIRYEAWFEEYGYDIYLPLLMKIPGVIEYNHYLLVDVGFLNFEMGPIPEQPPYLLVVLFKNIEAYENYAKSKELAAFRAALKSEFSGNLELKWYVQYQLVKSWRK